MNGIRWLDPADGPDSMPPASSALDEPNGLLAAGGSLAPEWLLASYARGIFPWYEHGQPILWWSPDPRMVLLPGELVVSRSLRKTLRKRTFAITADTAFTEVVSGCAAPRRYTDSTWITSEMARAYTLLFELGFAHSFESWRNGALAGGLYGVAVGKVFFGESMFSRETDASKVALVHAIRFLENRGYELIDCQLPSPHLRNLGARNMPRTRFLDLVDTLSRADGLQGRWSHALEADLGDRA